AGGATLAYSLRNSGKSILLIERGDFLLRSKSNWDAKAVCAGELYHTTEHWRTSGGKSFRPGTHYYVGGNTKVYGAALIRFREADFGEVVHEEGVSPAWPIKYKDLEKYYTEAERIYSVHGAQGEDPT